MLRDAASLILFKKTDESLRVLMGLRNAGHKFMPNLMVFPGGGVDPDDHLAPAASPFPNHAMARLQRSCGPELATALLHAAARELEEETGLTLGTPPGFAGLDYLCRAETPESQPIRFNARFFVGEASLASGTIAGSGELEALEWYEFEAIMKLELNLATRNILGQLQTWLELPPSERNNRKVPIFVNRVWTEE